MAIIPLHAATTDLNLAELKQKLMVVSQEDLFPSKIVLKILIVEVALWYFFVLSFLGPSYFLGKLSVSNHS